MPNTHTLTLGDLHSWMEEAETDLPQWMQDWYGYYGPELWVEVQEDDPLALPKIVQ